MTDPVAELAAMAGISPRYTDFTGAAHETGVETKRALLTAMGIGVAHEAEAAEHLASLRAERDKRSLPQWIVIEPDRPAELQLEPQTPWTITAEDGSGIEGAGSALPPLPLGIHTLETGGEDTTLLCAPRSLSQPEPAWGVIVPLWGLRGQRRPGLGDFNDLAIAGKAIAARGGAFVGINPIHAGFPMNSGWFSPYSPSHRRRLNVLHIATKGGETSGQLVDYAREVPAKLDALKAAYRSFCAEHDPSVFEHFVAEEGMSLRRFAAHQALSARHGPLWTDWPADCQSPASAPVDGLDDEIRFHAWLQWSAEEQLRAVSRSLADAGMRHGLYLDLAVGTHPAGAETWTDRDWFAKGVSLGAPPDAFAPGGQNWNLAPLNPIALVNGRFRILAETLRKQLRFARLLRIDHIIGFDRTFWVPDDADLPGAHVQMPRDALLAVIRIEAARAGATIVGEDLGHIPAGLQDALIASGILGCRVVQFEHGEEFHPPADYPALTLASFGTHDLPTWQGWRIGADIAVRRTLGHIGENAAASAGNHRSRTVRAFDAAAAGETPDAMHGFLARTGSALVALQAEDILDVGDQTNLPGTIHDYPNWQRKLPVDARDLGDDPRLERAATIMQKAGR
ncbi:4-alpha-glucanotransferase [Defluviimonas aquaemixtae]|uniref:4-alpha-glucanotransferase n=1 Tax=Albidovulum aquaemixtae TaxID=1542388 RepID=A0A2R8BNK6_9RHOB|nr:4-alpha-glucanotransferase [Defluviimonas aquaemixtae]SPH25030.1 4-alpha-glucanotransferase [Defluviimonas aquaemixtae]